MKYNVGDFYYKYSSYYGRMYAYDFFLIEEIIENKVIIARQISISVILNRDKEGSLVKEYYCDKEKVVSISEEKLSKIYLKTKIIGKTTYQDIIDITKKHSLENTYKIIRKMFCM